MLVGNFYFAKTKLLPAESPFFFALAFDINWFGLPATQDSSHK